MKEGLPADDTYIELLRSKYSWLVEDKQHETVPETNKRYIIGDNKHWIGCLQDFILNNYIMDDGFAFNRNAGGIARERIKQEDQGLYYWIGRHDKLRKPLIDSQYTAMESIASSVKDEFPELYSRLSRLLTFDLILFKNNYAVMDFESKAGLAKRLDDTAYKFLEELSR